MGSAATVGRAFLMKLNLAGSADEEEDEEEGKDGKDCGGKEGAGEAEEAGGCGHEEGPRVWPARRVMPFTDMKALRFSVGAWPLRREKVFGRFRL